MNLIFDQTLAIKNITATLVYYLLVQKQFMCTKKLSEPLTHSNSPPRSLIFP